MERAEFSREEPTGPRQPARTLGSEKSAVWMEDLSWLCDRKAARNAVRTCERLDPRRSLIIHLQEIANFYSKVYPITRREERRDHPQTTGSLGEPKKIPNRRSRFAARIAVRLAPYDAHCLVTDILMERRPAGFPCFPCSFHSLDSLHSLRNALHLACTN